MPSPTARFIPKPRLHEIDRIAVAADPAETWSVVRSFDLYALRYVRALFALRGAGAKTATLDEIVAPGNGFRCLAEDPGRFFVAGAIGRFWQRRIPFADVAPEDFASFVAPGFGRVVWSVEVYPRGDGGSWIVVDLRVDATTDEAWNEFVPYWIAIGRFSRSIRRHVLRHFERKLGRALPDEARALPGDQLIVLPRASVTDAITINAPVEDVWSQVFALRDVWPRTSTSTSTSTSTNASSRFTVIDVELHRALVLGTPSLLASESASIEESHEPVLSDYIVTWAFYLEPIGADATRLIVRVRADFAPTALFQLGRPFLFAAHALMESVHLWQLKTRAEAKAHALAA